MTHAPSTNVQRRRLLPAVILFFIVLAVGAATGYFLRGHDHGAEAATSDHDHGASASGETTQWYISGMHPWIIRPEPGYCPICGMELTPLDPAMLAGALTIDPLVTQNIGVRTAVAESGKLSHRLSLFGEVAVDERTRHRVVLRTDGYVERLQADFTARPVRRGEMLAEIHSPEVLAALGEWLALQRSSPDSSQARAAARRIALLGVPEETLEETATSGEIPWTFPVRAPADGIVRRLETVAGARINRGDTLLEILDLSRVWVLASTLGRQVDQIDAGQEAVFRLSHRPGRTYQGSVDFVFPEIDPLTRQGRVRLSFDNPDGGLKPGLYGRVELAIEAPETRTLVPRESILATGDRQVSFISLGDGRFEPREVVMGAESVDGRAEILEGIEPGEHVVISGQFLIDSESRLREALLKMVEGTPAAGQRVRAPETGPTEAPPLPDEIDRELAGFLEAYLGITASLFEDSLRGLAETGPRLAETAATLAEVRPYGEDAPGASVWRRETTALVEPSRALAAAGSLAAARNALRDLGEPLRRLLAAVGVPAAMEDNLHEIRCPMYPEIGDNAWWIQTDRTVANPFMGPMMATCHDRRQALPRAAVEAHEEAPPGDPLEAALRAYLEIGDRLVHDTLDGIAAEARRLADAAAAEPPVRDAARRLESARSLQQARIAFADTGAGLIEWIEREGLPAAFAGELEALRCPMFPELGETSWWIQRGDEVLNPLMGQRMLVCYDQRRPLNGQGEHRHD
ncbi:MAG: efflux RND transporter periplasmic adaptor subunit [Puniceicoccaceae bacterium]|nr:MAG: efflux RND transporter periplasmic adaptor subunit [Puniceicoccaceae bacterium]